MPVISIPCAGGLQTRVAEHLVQPPDVLKLENADLNIRGAFRLRTGTECLPTTTLDGGDLDITRATAVFYRGSELCAVVGRRLWSYAECPGAWADRGPLTTAQLRIRQIFSQSGDPIRGDVAVLAGGIVTAIWQTSAGVLYGVQTDSGAVLVPPTLIEATGDLPRAVSSTDGESALLVYRSTATGTWRTGTVMCAAPTAAVTWRNACLASSTFPVMDIATLSTPANPAKFRLLARVGNALLQEVSILDTGAVASTANVAVSNVEEVSLSSNANFALLRTGGVLLLDNGASLSLFYAATRMTARVIGALTYIAIEQVSDMMGDNQRVNFYTFDADNGFVLQRYRRGVGLASQAWERDGSAYVALVFPGAASCYLAEDMATGEIVARWGELGQAYGLEAQPSLPRPEVISDVAYLPAVFLTTFRPQRDERASENPEAQTGRELELISIDFSQRPLPVAELGGSAYLPAAGFVRCYDGGQRVVELDYHTIPTGIQAASVGGPGPSAGTYTLGVVWRDVDETGRVHWSGVGSLLFTHTGGGIQVTAPQNRLTARVSPRRSCTIEFYASAAGAPEVLYYAGSIANDPAFETGTFTVSAPDAALIEGPPIYTIGNGGNPTDILSNDPTPATDFVALAGRRLWTRDPRRGNVLRHTKELRLDYGAEISPILGLDLETEQGAVSVVEQDGVFYCLSEPGRASVSVWQGDGPSANGQGQYSLPETVPTSQGAISHALVAPVPIGWAYASERGIRLLTRDRQVVNLSSPVERLWTDDGQQVAGMVYRQPTEDLIVVDDRAEATGARSLRLNLGSQGMDRLAETGGARWASDTGWAARSVAVSSTGTVAYLRSFDGRVVRTTAEYLDQGQPIVLRFDSARIRGANLTSLLQLARVDVLGRYRSPHLLRIGLAYDGTGDFVDWVTFDPATLPNPPTWGGGTTWGGSEGWGSAADTSPYSGIVTGPNDRRVYWWRHQGTREFSDVQVRIEVMPKAAEPGPGADIILIELDITVVDGQYQLAQERIG